MHPIETVSLAMLARPLAPRVINDPANGRITLKKPNAARGAEPDDRDAYDAIGRGCSTISNRTASVALRNVSRVADENRSRVSHKTTTNCYIVDAWRKGRMTFAVDDIIAVEG